MHKPHECAHALTHSQAILAALSAEPKLCTYCGKCGYLELDVIQSYGIKLAALLALC